MIAAFLGAIGGPAIYLADQSQGDLQIDPSDAFAALGLASDGHIYGYTGLSTNDKGVWLKRGAAADYDVRATLNSGTLGSGSSATGSWISCASGAVWNVQDVSPVGLARTAQLTVEIRLVASGAVLDTAIWDLSAEVQF